MLEIPESAVISRQIAQGLSGRTIQDVQAAASPHGFAWYYGPPEAYPSLLCGCVLEGAESAGGRVQINAGAATMMFADGVNLRWLSPEAKRPKKHQLLLTLDDGSTLCACVQMYGGLWAYPSQGHTMGDNPYYAVALAKPSPLSDAFDRAYYEGLLAEVKPTISVKAFLATEQRIPGLGNGVLQDILFLTGMHPARPLRTLDAAAHDRLFAQVRASLRSMTEAGGRDTEKDLYGKPGGYRTLLSRRTHAFPCPQCGGEIVRKAYLGGNVYFCPTCQPLIK